MCALSLQLHAYNTMKGPGYMTSFFIRKHTHIIKNKVLSRVRNEYFNDEFFAATLRYIFFAILAKTQWRALIIEFASTVSKFN